MTDLPFSLRDRAMANLISGACTRFRRPYSGMYAELHPGNRLWLREPFALHPDFNAVSPSQAIALGAEPVFIADLARDDPIRRDWQCRPARTLPRAAHRYSAVVRSIAIENLLEITDADARAEGFSSREFWIADWDASIRSFNGSGDLRLSPNNPPVLVIGLILHRCPVKTFRSAALIGKEAA